MGVKITLRWLFIALSIAVPIGLVLLWVCWPNPRMSEAKHDIIKIEAFQKANGRLPETFSEIGVEEDESGPVYYQKQDNKSYILWFGLSLGESETYDSRSHSWSHHR